MACKEFNIFIGLNEMKNYRQLTRQIFAELLGTFMYLCLAPSYETGEVATALGDGLVVSTIVQIIGNVSGGHINPAITVGATVCGNIKLLRAVCYIAAQLSGAIAGSAVSYAVNTSSKRGQNSNTGFHQELRAYQVFALEFLMTFLLVAVFISVVDGRRGARGLRSAPLAVGLSITACQCACLPYIASLNPARTFGPAVVMGEWYYHWLYWVAPISGGAVAGLVYKFAFMNTD